MRTSSEQLNEDWELQNRHGRLMERDDQSQESFRRHNEQNRFAGAQEQPTWQEVQGPIQAPERTQSHHWPTALVTLLPSWKDDITVGEAREKWRTFVTQFEKVIMMQPEAFTENQKRVLLTVKGGQMVQKLLENLDSKEGVDDHNIYYEAKKMCSQYFDSNSMKLVDTTTFRNTMQAKDEPFTKYVGRLRDKARVCQFGLEQEASEIAQQIMNGAVDKRDFLNSAVLFPEMKLADLERLGTRFEMTRALRMVDSLESSPGEVKTQTVDPQTVYAVNERTYGRPNAYGQQSGTYRGGQATGNFRQSAASSSFKHENRGNQEEYLCEQYCGRRHVKGRCLAYGKRCDRCGKIGHFKAVCKSTRGESTRVRQVEEEVKHDLYTEEN